MARIGIDYTSAVAQAAGIGRYVRELIGALLRLDQTHTYRLFAASPDPIPAAWLPPAPLRRLPLHDKWLMRLWHRAQLPLPVEWITGPIDLFHSPDFTLPYTHPRTRTLLTVHDLSFVRDPESADDHLRTFLNRVVPDSVARADHILADSAATRDDLIELWDTPAGKITVLYCGVEARFRPVSDAEELGRVRQRYGIGQQPFVLSLSTLQPRKNYVRLIRAFARLAPRHPDLLLVLGGGKGWKYDEILAEPARLQIADRVRIPGFVTDEDLPALYSAAEVFAYPSLYEGFGIPLLEAMACGTPVLSSNRSSLPEVTGTAGIQVDPFDVEAMAAELERLLTDSQLRQELIESGLARAGRFTWEKAAAELIDVYNLVLSA